MCKKVKIISMLLCLLFTLTGCSSSPSGTYSGLSLGVPITLTFTGDNKVETNIIGLPVSGTYSMSGKSISIAIESFGISQTITGIYENDSIRFADVTLEKGEIDYNQFDADVEDILNNTFFAP